MGLEFSMPLGFRREMSGVRNAQLQLAKERAKLQEAELELSHQLAFAIRDMEAAQVLSQTNFNRRIAAQRQVEAVAAAYEYRHDYLRRALAIRSNAWPRPKATTSVRWSITTGPSCRFTIARARFWSTMAFTWPKGLGRARRTSTPSAGPGPAMPRLTWTTALRSPGSSAADRMNNMPTLRPECSADNTQNSKPGDPHDPELVPTPEPQPIDPGPQPALPTPAIAARTEARAGGIGGPGAPKTSNTIKITTETATAASDWKTATKRASKTAAQQPSQLSQNSSLPTEAGAARLITVSSADSSPPKPGPARGRGQNRFCHSVRYINCRRL